MLALANNDGGGGLVVDPADVAGNTGEGGWAIDTTTGKTKADDANLFRFAVHFGNERAAGIPLMRFTMIEVKEYIMIGFGNREI